MSLIKNPIFGGPKEGLAKFKIPMELAGISEDEKPTNVEKYTLFLELDTNKIYYYSGKAWVELGQAPR